MTDEEREYIKYRIAKANETIDEAVLMLSHGYLNTAVSRLYYACFYAVSALLLTEGSSAPKHSGVMALFNRNWIHTGRVPVDMGRFYRLLFDSRQKGDYEDMVSFEHDRVVAWLSSAKDFVSHIAQTIESQGI